MKELVRKIISLESSAGILLLLSAVLALIFQNLSFLADLYNKFMHLRIAIVIGSFGLDENIHFWINDALMAIFFFVIGLELKREMLEGQLKHFSQIFLPVFAAIGGVVFPALIFIAINWGDSTAMKGWAIPTATDIAFAVGVLALLGRRVPTSLKIFVLTLAIMDDLCAIVIIALFYSSALNLTYLALASVIVVLLMTINRLKVSAQLPYIILSILLWIFVLNSGIHATIAGVLAGFTIPLYNKDGSSMLKDMEHSLSTFVNFIILPLFAFANAGVNLSGLNASHLLGAVPVGIFLGLFLGKQVGIFIFSYLAIKLRLAYLPEHANWKQLYAISIICGIGFTMSLFVDNLAYGESSLTLYHGTDKLAILLGSFVSGVVGYTMARMAGNKPKMTG